MNDLKLSYSGGSGGFLLLHLLLLSGKFYAAFDTAEPLDNIIQKQWNISDHTKWKTSETWPQNHLTHSNNTTLYKLYFECLPTELVFQCNAKSLVVYTDIASQIELADYKKANWFIEQTRSTLFKNFIQEWRNHYKNIKDSSWPECASPEHIGQLPGAIRDEIMQNEYTAGILNKQEFFVNTAVYNGHLVHAPILPFLDSADIVVKLQDLVNSNGAILTDLLDIPAMNTQQLALITCWKKLHPPELLQIIGIDSFESATK